MSVETETTLESYFEFHDDGAIWIRGHRVGIDLLLDAYKAGGTPEQIAEEAARRSSRSRSDRRERYAG